ncbi:hypothetical protein [Ktedonobacter sp. SOSP1-52]|uniref:hypothetical protein n=1 Tax=Ktedonobacter sp. SOSP1-52 TaxID=2778366 RepID=UPI001F31441C|nr:hypothetical protein [Ktedonobacter sp. SOSP1-52]
MQQSISLHVGIGADGTPVGQGVTAVSKRATTPARANCLGLRRQIAEGGGFLSRMVGARILHAWLPMRDRGQDASIGIKLAQVIGLKRLIG